MREAVLFDMDGVLCDSEPLINAAAIAWFREQGVAVRPTDFTPFVGAGENRYIGGVADKYALPHDIEAAKQRVYELYLQLIPGRLQAFPGIPELLQGCRDAGLKVAVASSADHVKVAGNLREIGLPPERFDAVVHGELAEHKKPAPDLFLAAAARLGVPPARCVVVEDAVNGVQAAHNASMAVVAVTGSFSAEELAEADRVVDTIATLDPAALQAL